MEPTLVRDAGHILISNDGGSAWSTVSSLVHSSNGSSFDHHKINLGDFIGQTINVRFYFDTLDEEVNLFEGWYIDDVKVVCQATSLNNDPTDINLSSSSIDENQPANTLVGTFSTVDQDASDSHTYTLVAGVGDSDNASFQVASNQLQSSAIFDFESKSTYNIRVRTDDGQGGIFEKTFTIAINDVPEVDLSLTKTVDNPNPDEGDNVTFVITLINGSSSTTATNIQVTDILPAGITPVADSATQGNYDETTGIWSVGTLGTSTSTVLTITASIDSGTGGTSITNTAEVTAVDQGDNDSTPDNGVEAEDDQDSATISVKPVDLSLTKTVDNGNPDEGDVATFTVTLTNNSFSRTATGIEVTDILPAGITHVADSATQGDYDETSGIWSIGTLGTSTSTVLTITASINPGTGGTSITNTAEVTAVDQGDSDSTPDNGVEAEDDQDSATISVKPVDLSLTKTVDNSTPNVGNIVTFTITLTNNSISTPASNIQVTDQLPAGITHVADSATQGDYDETLGIWSIGTLGASTSTILTITASINSGAGGTSITNTAEITAVDQGDNDSTPNNGIATEDDQDSANINVTAPPSSSSSSSSGGGGGGGGSSARPVIAFDPEAFIFRSEENGGNPDPQTLRIWTSKSRSVLRFTVSEDAPWLTVGADEGISSDPGDKERIEISVKTSGLDAGSHEGMITISAGRANNDPQIIPVTLIIEEQLPPGVLSSFKSVVNKESDSEFVTRNEEILLNIPRNSIHNDLEDVEVEINVLDVDSLPIPSGNTIIVRAVELNTFIDGQVSPIDFEEPVELVFSLTDEDLALVDGDVSRFGVSLYRPETNEWEPLLVRHVSDPLPNGRLLVALNHFSIYALGVLEKRTDPELVSSPTPTPTIVPAAELVRTAVPTQVLEQAPRVVLTEIPQSPSFGRVTVVPTSAPSVLPTSTPAAKGSVAATPASEPPTATPTKMPAPVVAAVLLPTATVLAGLEDKVIVEVGEEGGFSMTTIAIMVLAGIAVAAGGFGVVQAMLSRDKPRQILRRTESGGFGVVQAMLSRDKLRQILRRGVVRAVLSRDKLRQILRRTESD